MYLLIICFLLRTTCLVNLCTSWLDNLEFGCFHVWVFSLDITSCPVLHCSLFLSFAVKKLVKLMWSHRASLPPQAASDRSYSGLCLLESFRMRWEAKVSVCFSTWRFPVFPAPFVKVFSSVCVSTSRFTIWWQQVHRFLFPLSCVWPICLFCAGILRV